MWAGAWIGGCSEVAAQIQLSKPKARKAPELQVAFVRLLAHRLGLALALAQAQGRSGRGASWLDSVQIESRAHGRRVSGVGEEGLVKTCASCWLCQNAELRLCIQNGNGNVQSFVHKMSVEQAALRWTTRCALVCVCGGGRGHRGVACAVGLWHEAGLRPHKAG